MCVQSLNFGMGIFRLCESLKTKFCAVLMAAALSAQHPWQICTTLFVLQSPLKKANTASMRLLRYVVQVRGSP